MSAEHPSPIYAPIVEKVEEYARAYGRTPRGAGWPNAADHVRRFDAMFDLVREPGPFRLLDLGCGPGLTLDYIQARGWMDRIDYVGIDVSPMLLGMAQDRWPGHHFELRDILTDPFPEGVFDYVLINGVFTGRCSISHDDMERFARSMIRAAWASARQGVGWNTMTIHVDWERDDLFHWPIDTAVAFCKAELSRHVVVRADYGLWEYIVQVHRESLKASIPVPPEWLDDGFTGARS
jgi:SAM-dependent methyltransferase